mmetsp:Transcript_12265/g.35588  ORF Transcript_12265/g.35588 Transcript_12265/m.35588 type:complete len:264 (-) Transcript_12265:253-1044(-)|eukprot:CAMPEP_0119562698 /NCGR_PEP_ID=MMETSP1352-20130426/21219_1 /TAXON_ID=265584 /ORGANISM="Stauroneis constricta, Strain CCMP1120" /LENGTH=263 /DNA_ID=CAMNT_0007611147 /DNA_START=214 /DNA_END=1005 /DNA_ORIENTATION=-
MTVGEEKEQKQADATPTIAQRIDDDQNQQTSSNPTATPDMCYHCFDILIDKLQGDGTMAKETPSFAYKLPDASVQCPIFVTWEKQHHRGVDAYELRGCIGNLNPQLLVSSVTSYALVSALKDRRFHPIRLDEVPMLRVSVSLLVQYEICRDVFDWVIGTHGISIKFQVGESAFYSATFLPEVARDQNWTHEKTLDALIKKAGYHGRIDETLLRSIHCTRYQSSKCKIAFQDYVANSHHQGQNPIADAVHNISKQHRWNQCVNS